MSQFNLEYKKYCFLLHTEYHLFMALSIYKYHINRDYEQILFCIAKSLDSKRLNYNFNFSEIPNSIFKLVNYEETDYEENKEIKSTINFILNEYQADCFLFFQDRAILDIYLAYQFNKKGVNTILGPDGGAAYSYVNKLAPRWRIQTYMQYHRFLRANDLWFLNVPIPSTRFGSLKFIKQICLPHTKGYQNITKATINKITALKSQEDKHLLKTIFNIDFPNLPDRKVLFYFNQPFTFEVIYNYEIGFLERLAKVNNEMKIIVKPHPLTPIDQLEKIKSITNISVFSSNIPAEFLLIGLKESIIFSFWSTVNFLEVPGCRSLWGYKLLQTEGIMIDYLDVNNPTEHIEEINEFSQIFE